MLISAMRQQHRSIFFILLKGTYSTRILVAAGLSHRITAMLQMRVHIHSSWTMRNREVKKRRERLAKMHQAISIRHF